MRKEILLSSVFGDNIFTRNSISSLFEKINSAKNKEFIFNFKGVKFISRSCADEYLKQKEKSSKKIIEDNMSKEICLMFRNVENQYKDLGLSISFEVCPAKGLVFAN